MIDGLEPLFQQIAGSMQAAIPEDWDAAQFEAIFYADGSTYEAEYTRKADGKAKSFQPSAGGSRAFRQLRERFRETGQPVWGRVSFELRSDGTFNVNWDYDNCDENGNKRFDEEGELRRHESRRNRLSS
ncbi:hypothetical protein VT84_34435 [Gemmata sp. SH-PL17]|uniref:immunity protein YezG family protein n=1 Tax=Gemmata sp. SH-PL17 TaxID=1630693 RepID=UPI00078EB1AE|nr:immunity protein YezG family protein [Gemmata sp. SH-PL17]AMV29544.1 hypothetical protein VT84_34435 [Gemmata sp. SH-PL17]